MNPSEHCRILAPPATVVCALRISIVPLGLPFALAPTRALRGTRPRWTGRRSARRRRRARNLRERSPSKAQSPQSIRIPPPQGTAQPYSHRPELCGNPTTSSAKAQTPHSSRIATRHPTSRHGTPPIPTFTHPDPDPHTYLNMPRTNMPRYQHVTCLDPRHSPPMRSPRPRCPYPAPDALAPPPMRAPRPRCPTRPRMPFHSTLPPQQSLHHPNHRKDNSTLL